MLRLLRKPAAACLLALALSMGTDAAQAQDPEPTGVVAGTVTDAESGEPLIGATVVLSGTTFGAATNAAGRYQIDAVPPGTYALSASSVGYAAERREVTVVPGERLRLDLALRPVTAQLEGLRVVALRPDLQPAARLNEQEVEAADVPDAGKLLRTLPGLGAARRGALGFDPNVRGLVEAQVGVYVDGVRSFAAGPLRMDSPLSHFDPSAIASVEVVKGPYALTWGGGNLSAIRVRTRGMAPPAGLHGTLQTGYDTNAEAVETSGGVTFARGRGDFALSGAYRQGQDYESGSGSEVPAGYTTGEVRGRAGFRTDGGLRLEVLGGYQDQRDIDYPGRLLDAEYFASTNGSVRLGYAPAAGPVESVDAQVYALRTTHRMDNDDKPTAAAGTFPNGNPRPPLDIGVEVELTNVGGRLAADVVATPALTLTLGGDVYRAYREAVRPFEAIRPDGTRFVPPFYTSDQVWPEVTLTDAGLFARAQRPFGDLSFQATGRVDFVTADAESPSDAFLQNAGGRDEDDLRATETNLSGALTLSVPLGARWSVALGVGTAARTADALERYSDRFPASKAQTSAEFQGNPALDPERSTQADVWLEAAYPRLDLQLNAFARRMSDYITLEPTDLTPLLPLSPPTVFRYVNGEATFYGAEASAAARLSGDVTVTAQGSYLWGEDETLDEPALGVIPPQAAAALRWTPRLHDALGSGLVEGTLTLVAEQDRVAETRGEQPTDGYATLDLRLGLAPRGPFTVTAGVRNVTDEQYANHLNARNPFTGVAIFEPGRAFFLEARVDF